LGILAIGIDLEDVRSILHKSVCVYPPGRSRELLILFERVIGAVWIWLFLTVSSGNLCLLVSGVGDRGAGYGTVVGAVLRCFELGCRCMDLGGFGNI